MSIAQLRRERASRKANFYKNLAVGSGFVLFGNLATYPGLMSGCLVVLTIAVLAIHTKLIATILAGLAQADRLRREKVTQHVSILATSIGLYIVMFILGGLV